MACTHWHTDTKTSSGTNLFGRKLRIWRHNQQLSTNKAVLRPVREIMDNKLFRFSYSSFKMVYFQRPDWVCGSICAPFKFPRLVQISYINEWGSFLSFKPTGLEYFVEGLEVTDFSLIVTAGFFPRRLVTSLLGVATMSGSLLTQAVDRWPEGSSISTAY